MSLDAEVHEFLEQSADAAGEAESYLYAALAILEDDGESELIEQIVPLMRQLETIEHKIHRLHNTR